MSKEKRAFQFVFFYEYSATESQNGNKAGQSTAERYEKHEYSSGYLLDCTPWWVHSTPVLPLVCPVSLQNQYTEVRQQTIKCWNSLNLQHGQDIKCNFFHSGDTIPSLCPCSTLHTNKQKQ